MTKTKTASEQNRKYASPHNNLNKPMTGRRMPIILTLHASNIAYILRPIALQPIRLQSKLAYPIAPNYST